MPSANGITETTRHPEYYITGGDLYLMAGNIHFRVHSYFFIRESPLFKEWLAPASPSPGEPIPGSKASSALIVQEATPEELETFLGVIYNTKYTIFENMTVENWTTVLNLAHKWKFGELKAAAIRELQSFKLDTVPRMALYQKNDVDIQYILPLYVDLCEREDLLTFEEAMLLGHKTSYSVYTGREILRSKAARSFTAGQDPPKSPVPGGMPRESIESVMRTLLGIPPDVDDVTNKSTNGNKNTQSANGRGQGTSTSGGNRDAQTGNSANTPKFGSTSTGRPGRNTTG